MAIQRPRTRRPARPIPEAIRLPGDANVNAVAVDDIAEEILITFDNDVAGQMNQAPGGVEVDYGAGVFVFFPYSIGDRTGADTMRIPAPGIAPAPDFVRGTAVDLVLADDGNPFAVAAWRIAP